MSDYSNQWYEFLSPELLRQKLVVASIFIAVYENFKSHIVDNLKYFYWSGYKDGKEDFKDYEENVLSKISCRENRQIRATLLWYKEHGAISEDDIKSFKQMTDLRNTLGHDLLNKMFEGLPSDILDTYIQMIELFDKISKWWIKEIEIPTNPDITPEQYESIRWDEITSVNIEIIRAMTDIALTGNEKYLEILDSLGK